METGPIMPASGGYRNLEAFKLATIVYDGTTSFCNRFVAPRSRTNDQMIQAARSGKQNIVEGSMASATSSKSEIFLLNVARASLEELLNDYEDYLRQNGHRQWDKNEEKAAYIRKIARREEKGYKDYCKYVEEKSAETAANTMICVINQASFLLRRMIKRNERNFVEQGGLTERMHAARSAARRKQQPER